MGRKKKQKVVIAGFSSKQRDWFMRRDDAECQFIVIDRGEPHKCGAINHLHLHHIRPRYWAYMHLKLPDEKVNDALNGLIICSKHHTELIHADFGIVARQNYKYTDMSFKNEAEKHRALTRAGIPYWFTAFDDTMIATARLRTWQYLRDNPEDPYPPKKHWEVKDKK